MENNEKNKGGASSGKKSGTPSEKKKGKTASSKSGTSGASVKGASGKESGKSSAVKKGGTSASKSPKTAASPEFRFRKSSSKALRRAFRRHGFSGALNPDCAGCVCVCGGEILYFRVLLHRPAAFRREPDGSRFRGIFVRHPVPLFRKFSVWLFLQ